MTRLVTLACFVALAGCRPADEVRTYTLPKTREAAVTTPAPAEATDRLLGALIPASDGQLFSVKLSGPIGPVSAQAEGFRRFVESVRVTPDPAEPLKFDLPAGWKAGPARQMRLATFVVGGGPKPLEVAVFPPFGGSLLDNVNRWREQVGAAKVTEADLPNAAPEIRLGESKAYYVDARGAGGSGAMSAPFAPKR